MIQFNLTNKEFAVMCAALFAECQKDLLQTSLLNPGFFWLKSDPIKRKSNSLTGQNLISHLALDC